VPNPDIRELSEWELELVEAGADVAISIGFGLLPYLINFFKWLLTPKAKVGRR
jgi:hypothetical protein